MPRGQHPVDHLLRRAGFGASVSELAQYQDLPLPVAVDRLIEYQRVPDDVDASIGAVGYVGITTRGQFSPNTSIEDARQRWLFRMVHTQRPLQEKMALFWHQHFATAYSKLAGVVGAVQATKMMALKEGELPGPQGQIELFRRMGLGKFRELLVEVARDPAMIVWLDGRTNTRARPQENFGREVMELFTFGLGHYGEQDVYAAARVFTGWNLRLSPGGRNDDPNAYYEFFYNPAQHDATAKTFTFPIYRDGGKTIAARATADGMQDGIDLLNALARHPETARRLARKLWAFFVSDVVQPDPAFVETIAAVYLDSDTDMRAVVSMVLRSQWLQDPQYWYTRYAWPVEFVVRAIKEIGWTGFSIDTARTPLVNMGQTLFEPPDVNGWDLGPGWFSTGAMLARMNFASTLAANQRFNLARDAAPYRSSPERVTAYFLERMSPATYDGPPLAELVAYLRAGVTWSGADAQLNTKCPGLARLIAGSAEYQLV